MANSVTTQVVTDGDRNYTIKVVGILDTSDHAVADLITLSDLAPIPTAIRLDEVEFSVDSPLAAILYWKATTDVPIITMTQSDHQTYKDVGGLNNNSGTGKTGGVRLATKGYTSGTLTFSFIARFTKQYTGLVY